MHDPGKEIWHHLPISENPVLGGILFLVPIVIFIDVMAKALEVTTKSQGIARGAVNEQNESWSTKGTKYYHDDELNRTAGEYKQR